MADMQAVLDAITSGECDSQLGTLFDALFTRAAETETSFGWCLTLGDDSWSVEDVTLQELAWAERAVSTAGNKVSYLELDPLRSMDHLVALVVAHLHYMSGLPLASAFDRARKLTVTDLRDIVSVHEVKAAPKADGGGTSMDS